MKQLKTKEILDEFISKIKTISFLVIFMCCINTYAQSNLSMNSKLDKALSYAGNNEKELEKVLMYFKDNSESLKYQSAKFLIENMPYYYSIYGESAEKYQTIYGFVSRLPMEVRGDAFNKTLEKLQPFNFQRESDIRAIKADYLIKSINEAVDLWNSVGWNKNYEKKYFLNYILPYRISNEPLSMWRDSIAKIYPYLGGKTFWSNRGIRFIAAENKFGGCRVMEETSSLTGKSVLVENANQSVSFNILSDIPSSKLVNLRYNTSAVDTKAAVYLNGKLVDIVELEPTVSIHTFRSSRFWMPINLNKGNNELLIKAINNPFVIDYLELASVSNERSDLVDYSDSLCLVKNIANGNYISMDSLSQSMEKPVYLKRFSDKDENLLLSFDYEGYPCWEISPKNDPAICLENRWVSLLPKNAVGEYKYLRAKHQKWVVIPIGNGLCKIMNKDSGLYLEADEETGTDKEIIVQNQYNGSESQQWQIIKKCNKKHRNDFFPIGSAVSEALKVTDVMNHFEFINNTGSFPPSLAELCKYKTGTCREEAAYLVAMLRSIGVPSTIDFTPHWGNRTNAHEWSVILLPNGKATPFYMGCEPGDTAQYFHSYLKPKVFRNCFQMNRDFVYDFRFEKSIPDLFINPKFIDVTDEYCKTTNVTRIIPQHYLGYKVAYICVFDAKDWVPVFYGRIDGDKVTFKSMGRNIIYSMAFFENETLQPVGNPFIINSEGKVRDVVCDYKNRESMTLLRKYSFFGKQDFFNLRMAYGKFQGSNKSDFSDATTFFMHEGITEGCWYERKILDNKAYQYLRYLSPENSFGNINELEFYDLANNKLKGVIIGTQGTQWQTKETVFDGNILTGFNGISPDGHWVGLKLDEPTKISKIRYIPRNDGNCIEVGDLYQLNVYDNGMWRILGKKKATETKLVFNNMPSGGLYLLNDLTKGHEERIFTFEKGKQVWW